MKDPVKKASVSDVISSAEDICRARGVRLTAQRKSVLALLIASEKPMTAYDLLDQMREIMKNPAPPTVYRALDFLLKQGLIHKLESLHAYVSCSHPDHGHASQFLICDDCGDVAEVEDPALSKGLKQASESLGFQTKRPIIELLGTCADCAAKHQ